ncbi:hypothetical protein THAOC_08350, partial [Thalassiosira oceanica]
GGGVLDWGEVQHPKGGEVEALERPLEEPDVLPHGEGASYEQPPGCLLQLIPEGLGDVSEAVGGARVVIRVMPPRPDVEALLEVGSSMRVQCLGRELAEADVRLWVVLAEPRLLAVAEREEALHHVENSPHVLLVDAEVRQVEESVLSERPVDTPGREALSGGRVVPRDAAAAIPDERREADSRGAPETDEAAGGGRSTTARGN